MADHSSMGCLVVETLFADRCVQQSKDGVKYEGAATDEVFKALGQFAARRTFAKPAVVKGAKKFSEYIDKPKLEAVFTAGKQAVTVATSNVIQREHLLSSLGLKRRETGRSCCRNDHG